MMPFLKKENFLKHEYKIFASAIRKKTFEIVYLCVRKIRKFCGRKSRKWKNLIPSDIDKNIWEKNKSSENRSENSK